MTFGEKVRQGRKNLGYSQKQLSDMTGISLRTIVNYEHDERLPKKRSTYLQLAEALRVNVDSLLDQQSDFLQQAAEMYGEHGRRQAAEIIAQVRALYAGGSLEESDMDEMMLAIQDAYWVAKKRNSARKSKDTEDGLQEPAAAHKE